MLYQVLYYVYIFNLILTVLMIIDCAINRRDLYWFFVLVILSPFWGIGGLAYAIYNYETVTFPFRFAQWRAVMGGSKIKGVKRCPRCARSVARLEPYQDARSVIYLCAMCRAEMDFSRSGKIQ